MGKVPKWLLQSISKAPKMLSTAEKPLHDLLKPGGKELGVRSAGASIEIRTLTKQEFKKLKADVLDGAVEVPSRSAYPRKWYQRPDGTIVGLRNSPGSGETLDVIKSSDQAILKNGYKVHYK